MLRSSNSVLKTAHIHGVFRKSRCTLSLLEVRRMNSAQPLAVDEYNGEHSWQQTRYQTATMTPIPQEYEQLYFTSPTPEYKPTIRRDHVKPKIPQHLKNDIEIQEDQESTYISPNHLSYAGETEIPITSKLHIVKPNEDTPRGIWPVFRLMDQDGCFRNPALDGVEFSRTSFKVPDDKVGLSQDLDSLRHNLLDFEAPFQADEIDASGLLRPANYIYTDIDSRNTLWRIYRQTIRLREMDNILLNAQRQGRISFYMTCTGEEAIHMGAASALDTQDHILAQYREQGLLMWRGFTLEQFTNQCFSNDRDLGKGRQMPVHYGSRALNYHTISSPLGTQLPQAVGVAYRLKLEGKPNVAVAFFGEGCASTTDFHSAMNFAAALSAPVLFICRNNGYAISTPAKEQYVGDGIVVRAPGYGMAAIRVDGNDVFAVHAAIREAKKYALENSAPVLIEAITYRIGHHSTSDDSSAYRDMEEVHLIKNTADPLQRLESFLKKHNWLDEEEIKSIQNIERDAVLSALNKAEMRPKPSVDSMFEDVYCEIPPHLQAQKAQLEEHMALYPDYYK